EGAAADVVEGPSRGGDDDVDTAFQGPQLAADGLAAVDGEDACLQVAAVAVECFRYLQGQFPGGHQDERRGSVPAVAVRQPVQDRQGEGCGLPRTGCGLAEQVTAFQQRGDRLALDGRGLLVADLG